MILGLDSQRSDWQPKPIGRLPESNWREFLLRPRISGTRGRSSRAPEHGHCRQQIDNVVDEFCRDSQTAGGSGGDDMRADEDDIDQDPVPAQRSTFMRPR